MLLMISLALLVTGCLSSAYRTKSIWALVPMRGYEDSQIGVAEFAVSYAGNNYCSEEKAKDFAMLRCAELALQNGYGYFELTSFNIWTAEQRNYGTGYADDEPRVDCKIRLLSQKQGDKEYDAKRLSNIIRSKYRLPLPPGEKNANELETVAASKLDQDSAEYDEFKTVNSLRRLKQLKDDGILNDEEYELRRKALVDKL